MKILRLTYFNIKKHRSESVSIVILMMICMILLGSASSSLISIQSIFGDTMEKYHGIRNHVLIRNDKDYFPAYDEIFASDERVTKFEHIDCITSVGTKYLDVNGEECSQYMCFVNEENERKIEDFIVDTELSPEEIAAIEHPLYAPFYVKDSLGMKEGDTFTMIYNGKQYPFTIAGFAESCIYSDNTMFLKIVIGGDDYDLLQKVIGKSYILGYETEAGKANEVFQDFKAYVEENTSNGEALRFVSQMFEELEFASGGYIKIVLIIMMAMSAVVLVSLLVMIRHRITSDISEQVVSIGVLEALGYRSGDISLSYVLEYVLLGLIGVVLGIIGSVIFNPILFRVGEMMSGHHGTVQIQGGLIAILAILLLLLVAALSFFKSGMVKKYPPVVAFRKGINDHHFGESRLPLSSTRTNVHVRLALKGALSNTKQNIGIAICVAVSTFTIVGCFLLFSYCNDGMSALRAMAGIEMPDLSVVVTDDTDIERMREELLGLPEVKKINLSSAWLADVSLQYKDYSVVPIIYENFDVTDQIIPLEGRLPKHDNEVMLGKMLASQEGINVGDMITFKFGKIEKEYLVCGTISCMTNTGRNVYFTDSGMQRIKPSYKPRMLEITLNEGVDKDEFSSWLSSSFGRTIQDALEDEGKYNTSEERIRAEAEKKMATLLSVYGLSHVEYAIKIGDTMIKGSSSIFKIELIHHLKDIMETQLKGALAAFSVGSGIFMIIAVLVVMIIMFMIMESSVKKQRGELGIFKGLGYTSRELMLQLSFKIIPVLVAGIILGSVLGVASTNILTAIIGKIEINYSGILILDIAIFLFAFLAAYFGARKIRKISVYELMTE